MATLDPCTSEQAQSVHIDANPIVVEEQGPTGSSIGLIRRRVVRACPTTAKSYENEIQRCEVGFSSRFIRAIERRREKKNEKNRNDEEARKGNEIGYCESSEIRGST